MKKLIFLFTLVLSLCSVSKAQYHDFSAPNADGKTIYYKILLNEDGTQTSNVEVAIGNFDASVAETGRTDYIGTINIPSQVSYGETIYTVKGIGDNAFYLCYGLTSVTIPSSVTTIGNWAFSYCTLTSIVIPNSVTTMESSVFTASPFLSSVSLSDNLETIPYAAFNECTSLTSIVIPNTVTSIGNSAFKGSGLTSVVIPDDVTYIQKGAFQNCGSLKSVSIGNSVTRIWDDVFKNCPNLTTVVLGNSVSEIFSTTFNTGSNDLTVISLVQSPTEHFRYLGSNYVTKLVVPCERESYYQENSNFTTLPPMEERNFVQYDDVVWIGEPYNANGFNLTSEQIGNGGVFTREDATVGENGCSTLHIISLTALPRSGTLTSKAGEWAAENAGAWTHTATSETTEWIVSNGSTVTFASQPTDGTIIVKDGGELVAEVELPNVTVEKTTVPNQWNFMGFPIKETNGVEYLSQGSGDIWALGFNYYQSNWDDNYLYWTDESHSLVVQGNGIFVFPEEANTFKIRGTVPASGSTVSVTNPVSGPVQTGRYMALANPYAERLDIATFLANANSGTDPLIIQGEVVYRYNEENGNSSYEPLSSGEIEVGEGFFVNMNDGYVTVNIDNSPIAQAKSTPREFLTLSVSTDGYKVPVKFAVNQAASQDYDIYDANKMFGSGTVAEPYLFGNNVMLCKEEVDALPYTAKMNVRTREACSVEISADRIPEQYTLTLVDGEEEIPMQEGDTYAAELINGENSNRFRLKIGKGAVSIQDIAQAESLNIRANNRFITVSGSDNITTEVYNALGQKVYETKDRSFELNGVAAGAYIVKATDGRATHSTKIIIQ